jgi:endoglucanase
MFQAHSAILRRVLAAALLVNTLCLVAPIAFAASPAVELVWLRADAIRLSATDVRFPRELAQVADGFGLRAPAGVGIVRRGVARVPVGKNRLQWPPTSILRSDFFLVFDAPIRPGQGVTLALPAELGGGELSATFSLDQPSVALKVDQVGFRPGLDTITAYYGLWAGTLGAIDLSDSATPFAIVSENGARVFEGVSELVLPASPVWGEAIHRFVGPKSLPPGQYWFEVDGVGRTPRFRVAPDVHRSVLGIAQRAFLDHRCGVELRSAHTLYPRPACHLEDGIVPTELVGTPLYAGELPGARRASVGGWHDASDYGKYVSPASVALVLMLWAAEQFPAAVAADNLGIPESGNGIPDLLDEVCVELDWLLTMQGPSGGVYHKLTALKYNTETPPHRDDQRRVFAEMTTHDTGRFAAVMARAARVLAPLAPARAQRYREAAVTALDFLRAHPESVPNPGFSNRSWTGGGDYADRYGDRDERAWAAAEWMQLEGRSSPELEQWVWGSVAKPWRWANPPFRVHDWPPPFEDCWRWALYTYCGKGHPGTNRELCRVVDQAWIERAKDLARTAQETPYGVSFLPKLDRGFGFGHMNGLRWALDFAMAEQLLGASPASEVAKMSNVHVLFGANGPGLSFVTGVGERAVTTIEYSLDLQRPTLPAVPGHPVDGPASGFHPSSGDAAKATVPPLDTIPPALRYFELPDVTLNEPTVLEMAELVALLASLVR